MHKTVVVGGDHFALDACEKIRATLSRHDVKFRDFSSTSTEDIRPLATLIPQVVEVVRSTENSCGILICGTGAGVEIGANKFRSIRASLCVSAEQARNARQYDNINILCIGSWMTKEQKDIDEIVTAFLDTEFDGNPERTRMLEDFDSFH